MTAGDVRRNQADVQPINASTRLADDRRYETEDTPGTDRERHCKLA